MIVFMNNPLHFTHFLLFINRNWVIFCQKGVKNEEKYR